MAKTLSIIVAIALDNGIGNKNQLLAHLPDDLRRFKSITQGHPVIMGRNTWFSLPKRPLPNRQNIVITNIADETFEGADTAYSIEQAIEKCPDNKESFVIGGAMIYRQFFDVADKLYITRMHKTFEADTYFPVISNDRWETEWQSEIFSDEKCGLEFQYINFKKR